MWRVTAPGRRHHRPTALAHTEGCLIGTEEPAEDPSEEPRYRLGGLNGQEPAHGFEEASVPGREHGSLQDDRLAHPAPRLATPRRDRGQLREGSGEGQPDPRGNITERVCRYASASQSRGLLPAAQPRAD